MRRTVTMVLSSILVCTVLGGGSRSGAAAASHGEPRRVRVIISTDIATGLQGGWRGGINDIDDGLAVAMALSDPALDVRGIVPTFGNNDLGPEMVVAERLVHDLLGSSVPIYPGAAVPLSDPQVAWFDGTAVTESCVNDGVRFMASELRRGPVTVLALGPLTDVACLVQNFPREANNIAEVVSIMRRAPGQSFAIGPISGLTDFNLARDPRAAQIVLEESAVPLTFLTFALTSSAFVPSSAIEALRGNPSPLARFVVDSADPWVAFWQKTFREDGFHPWDQNAVYYPAHRDTFLCVQAQPQFVRCPSDPYHSDADNPCAGHGPGQPTSLDRESAQLWLTADTGGRATMCSAYASDTARQAFLNATVAFLD